MDYYERAGLVPYLEKLGFGLVGFGCTTCIGNSGPLAPEISEAIRENGLAVSAVLSGNRNFEGRISEDVRMNYLASPPLVVAYAIAGTMDIDVYNEPLATDSSGNDVYLRDIWPTADDVAATLLSSVKTEGFVESYAHAFAGDERWRGMDVPTGNRYSWEPSTYVVKPPYFDGMKPDPDPVRDIEGARVLLVLGDSVTTDHISPAGTFRPATPAGAYLIDKGVAPGDFSNYGARRGNHEIMMRGTFANPRIHNRLASAEGSIGVHLPDGTEDSIFATAMRYAEEGTPLVVLAGREYGSGSSRDWAAKGPLLLGVRAAIAQSFERIHRSNLIGMGIAPIQFLDGESVDSLGLTGRERFSITGIEHSATPELIRKRVHVVADDISFDAILRIDTPTEAEYFAHGGILRYVVRKLAGTI
jgi:aconitate hydratase